MTDEPHLDELGFSDAEDDSYNGYGPYVNQNKPHRIINGRVDNFEFKSESNSDDDDGFTDSLYKFSNSTSDGFEITDPDTDSHVTNRRDTIEELKANWPLYRPGVHGSENGHHEAIDIHANKRGHTIPDAFDYAPLRDALGHFTATHGYGGVSGNEGHYVKNATFADRFDYMRFSDEYEECYDCGPEHPDHRHHALDHPGTHDHTHVEGAVDKHGVAYPKPYHNHDSGHPAPPQENLYNRDIALNIRD